MSKQGMLGCCGYRSRGGRAGPTRAAERSGAADADVPRNSHRRRTDRDTNARRPMSDGGAGRDRTATHDVTGGRRTRRGVAHEAGPATHEAGAATPHRCSASQEARGGNAELRLDAGDQGRQRRTEARRDGHQGRQTEAWRGKPGAATQGAGTAARRGGSRGGREDPAKCAYFTGYWSTGVSTN